ncbi:ERF superfamily [uncultured Sporomusa sp.]|uniref:ERF superfamily n=1 Tax=uncultured Sporomusa sp. TaxID=307249 RepID=A0A212LYF6_9FIRM|nr:ERF family protein [uncultured Sporomusa sp.]SCM82572.1 ERF superfamily [uncultured Sporomusa sp.]
MKHIAGKIVKIMEECSVVKKNGTNDFHHYKYTTSADVLEKVNAALVKNKVASVVLPEVIDSGDVVTSRGNTEHLVTVKVTITLIDTESGESIQIAGTGSGQDGGDKAVMKAQTAAIKYAYLLSLAISTNDDPEADNRTDEGMSMVRLDNYSSVADNVSACSDCSSKITAGVMKVSMNKFGRPLCMKCQKKNQGVA